MKVLQNIPQILPKPLSNTNKASSKPATAAAKPAFSGASDVFVKSAKGAQSVRFGAFGYRHITGPVFMDATDQNLARLDKLQSGEIQLQRNLFDEKMMADLKNATHAGPGERVKDPNASFVLKNNIIFINDVISDSLAHYVVQKTMLLASAMKALGKNKPVRFIVQSPGGSITAMNAILDAMDELKNTKISGENIVVETYGRGLSASAASVIMANGTRGHRYLSPRAEIMIHQPLGGMQGQATDMAITNKRIQKMKDEIKEFFVRTTHLDGETLAQLMERDYYMDAKECVDKGFVDHITSSFGSMDVAKSDLQVFTGDDGKSSDSQNDT